MFLRNVKMMLNKPSVVSPWASGVRCDQTLFQAALQYLPGTFDIQSKRQVFSTIERKIQAMRNGESKTLTQCMVGERGIGLSDSFRRAVVATSLVHCDVIPIYIECANTSKGPLELIVDAFRKQNIPAVQDLDEAVQRSDVRKIADVLKYNGLYCLLIFDGICRHSHQIDIIGHQRTGRFVTIVSDDREFPVEIIKQPTFSKDQFMQIVSETLGRTVSDTQANTISFFSGNNLADIVRVSLHADIARVDDMMSRLAMYNDPTMERLNADIFRTNRDLFGKLMTTGRAFHETIASEYWNESIRGIPTPEMDLQRLVDDGWFRMDSGMIFPKSACAVYCSNYCNSFRDGLGFW
jgi:hypothetical protein